MNSEKDTKPPRKLMTDEQLASGLRGLREMAREAMPKERRERLMGTIQALKALQKVRAKFKDRLTR